MASTIKVDQIQSDTGTVNLASNLAFSSAFSMSGPVTLNSPTIATPTMTGQAVIPSINLTSGQIVFPATQNPSAGANTLDDYEEGTFTPAYSFTGGGTVTHGFRSGLYIKIGQLVWISVAIRSTAVSGISGALQVTGLPFTAAGNSRTGGSGGFIRNWQSDMPNFRIYGAPSATTALFYKQVTNAGTSEVTSADFSTGSDNNVIEFSLVYRASA
jgi:hypothetical protein